MACGAANLIEYFLALLYLCVVQVAGTGNGQSAVPHEEGVVVVVAHLGGKTMPGVVKLVGGRTEQVAHGNGSIAMAPNAAVIIFLYVFIFQRLFVVCKGSVVGLLPQYLKQGNLRHGLPCCGDVVVTVVPLSYPIWGRPATQDVR